MSENNPSRTAMLQLVIAVIIIISSLVIHLNRKNKAQIKSLIKTNETNLGIAVKSDRRIIEQNTDLLAENTPVFK